jgi:hypothetical protein
MYIRMYVQGGRGLICETIRISEYLLSTYDRSEYTDCKKRTSAKESREERARV